MFSRNQIAALATAVAGAMSIATRESSAALVIDLRAVSTTGGSVINPKMVFFTGALGNTVTMNIIAVTTGNDTNFQNDGLFQCGGSFLSANGGLLGNLAAVRDFDFLGTGGSNGLMTDLDGDGDLDVGSNNDPASANHFLARAGQFAEFGTEMLVGTLTWTFTGGGYDTSINFRPRRTASAASWFEDGTQFTGSNFSAGVPVIITLPEPSMLSLSSMLGLPLLARRRR